MNPTLGVILAGGAGRRLGLGPKALVPLGGVTLLDRARRVLESRCTRVLVCAPAGVAASFPPVDLVRDAGEGPLAALVTVLGAVPFARAIVLGIDFPFVQGALIDGLAARLARHDAVVPAPGGVPQPLVAVYAASAAAPLAAALARGERSLSRALGALAVEHVPDATLRTLDPASDAGFNLNTNDDRLEAERRLRTEAA